MKSSTSPSQQQLEEKAINAMIAFERRIISRQEMHEAITLALRFYGNVEGHRKIALKGWIIKTIYALDRRQLAELEQIIPQYEATTPQTKELIINHIKNISHERR